MAKWLLLCISLFWLPAQAGLLDSLTGNDEPDFLPVEQAFPLTTLIDNGQLYASWHSADGYYLYKHRIFIQQGELKADPVYYSHAGKEKEDEAFGLVTAFYGELDTRFDLSRFQPGELVLHHQGCADAGLCYPPQRYYLTISQADIDAAANTLATANSNNTVTDTAGSTSSQSNTDSWFSNRSWGAVVGLFFLLGLGLTFTPCVLPMVPILTTVVLGQKNTSASRGFILSSIYVLGMALTYAAAGLTVGLLGAGANIQAWMQTPWVLILFAVLFVLLALAMFGLYELQLPSGLRNRLNQLNQNQKGGQWLSVFIMGILSALVVSPCVSAPLAGALVYLSTTGDAILGGSALLALGLGMGAPLIVLGTTGASFLPKAGGWMNQIKAFFGILLLGVAIWLLSRILPENISLLLWALLALFYGISLGALEPAASGIQRLVKGLAWVFLLYGIIAFVGVLQGNSNPLQPLSGSQQFIGSNSTPAHSSAFFRSSSVAEIEKQIAASQQPVMLDLYADWCISCKVMEEEIFAQPDVQQMMKNVLWLQLDVTDNSAEQIAFMQKHAIFGPPTILFFSQQQEMPAARIVGELGKDRFVAHIRKHLP
ncbi:protein-disulfide reductase DsbD [Thalassolituus hydrocarboniclasticus]|uniref:Thiol:disulfide interchange protein DsbD n=1 Tax=Thalassolituus hydrocarboniclasticus TaxID=2742796 RepID=A0ABY6A8S3_9GAMM|nr:protein-disulfide reductase DsbD [Thalassolituus hydrocarboniclasticus]UXD86636.1 protein-disulfide reductase DsbD [Thalassolituus hydrocarboniclasticus]